MEIIPLGNSVVIEIDDRKSEIDGIAIPDMHQRRSETATVVECGKDVRDLKVGDRILIPQFGATELKLPNGEKKTMLSEDNILAVLT